MLLILDVVSQKEEEPLLSAITPVVGTTTLFSLDYGRGIDIEILGSSEDSYTRYQNGELKLEGNVFWNVASGMIRQIAFTITAAKVRRN